MIKIIDLYKKHKFLYTTVLVILFFYFAASISMSVLFPGSYANGTVIDSSTNQPIEGSKVTIVSNTAGQGFFGYFSNYFTNTGYSDKNGNFSFKTDGSTSLYILIEKEGYLKNGSELLYHSNKFPSDIMKLSKIKKSTAREVPISSDKSFANDGMLNLQKYDKRLPILQIKVVSKPPGYQEPFSKIVLQSIEVSNARGLQAKYFNNQYYNNQFDVNTNIDGDSFVYQNIANVPASNYVKRLDLPVNESFLARGNLIIFFHLDDDSFAKCYSRVESTDFYLYLQIRSCIISEPNNTFVGIPSLEGEKAIKYPIEYYKNLSR